LLLAVSQSRQFQAGSCRLLCTSADLYGHIVDLDDVAVDILRYRALFLRSCGYLDIAIADSRDPIGDCASQGKCSAQATIVEFMSADAYPPAAWVQAFAVIAGEAPVACSVGSDGADARIKHKKWQAKGS